MKKMSVPRLAVTYAGCFLGAGLVSGQEIWQFFGAFGAWGIAGLLLTLLLIGGLGVLILRLVQRSGIGEMDALVVRWRLPWLRGVMGGAESLLLFGVLVVMAAGAGSLTHQILPTVPAAVGAAVFCTAVAAIVLAGARSITGAFSTLVPALAAVTVVLGVLTLRERGLDVVVALPDTNDNPLLHDWILSSVMFVAYNLFGSIGVLTALHRWIPDKKRIVGGVALGSLLLGAIAFSILLAMMAAPEATAADLPMLTLATEVYPVLGWIYAVLLWGGMFGAGMLVTFALLTYLQQKMPRLGGHTCPVTLVLCGAGFAGSLAGFGDLIGVIYPLFGYFSLVAIALLAEHAWHLRRYPAEI